MGNEERDYKRKQELKLFIEMVTILLLIIFFFTRISFAEDVIVADAPILEETNQNEPIYDDSTVIASIRSRELDMEASPSIIYAGVFTDTNAPFNPDLFVNGSKDIAILTPYVYGTDLSIINNGDPRDFFGQNSELGGEGIDIYIPDSDDDCPVSESVPLSVELQEYLWTKCKKATSDYKNFYAFCLGVMEHESTFRPSATHHNKNGSVDRGIMQINSSNIGKMKKAGFIGSADDLYDAYRCIDCGLYMLTNYIGKFGVSESAYYAYNTGREREGSNSNSRKVMQYMQKWNAILFS